MVVPRKVLARRSSLSSKTLMGTIIDLLKFTFSTPIDSEKLFRMALKKIVILNHPLMVVSSRYNREIWVALHWDWHVEKTKIFAIVD